MQHCVFDGHNDLLSRLAGAGGVEAAPGFARGLPGQLDLPRARSGGFCGGFFAMWARSELAGDLDMLTPPYDVALPPPLPQAEAWEMVADQARILRALHDLGHLRLCTSVAGIEAARTAGEVAAILHLEGADAIGPDLAGLDRLHDMGLRSLGPVWSRPTIFGHGVPFRYPSTGDTGPGLTEAGRALIARCNEKRILIDLSHMTEAGFRDVADLSTAPLVATHSNAHAVAPHARNLTDAQLDAIARSGGVAGLNFERTFLRPDGVPDDDIPEAMAMAHLDHMLARLGEEGVAIGSDYDGCVPPHWLNSADKLPALIAAMERHGYAPDRIERICWGNWMRVLRETWGG